MITHLSSQEFVNALDGALTCAQQSHLDGCVACQAQLADLRALAAEVVQGAGVPEPSPLFWDHFQARVLAAVQIEDRPGRQAWWMNWMDARSLFAIGAIVVALSVGVTFYVNRPVTISPGALSDGEADSGEQVDSAMLADASGSLDADAWEFVSSVMSELEGDDIHEVLTPSHDAVNAAIEALTSAERDRLMKLLKAELAEGLE